MHIEAWRLLSTDTKNDEAVAAVPLSPQWNMPGPDKYVIMSYRHQSESWANWRLVPTIPIITTT